MDAFDKVLRDMSAHGMKLPQDKVKVAVKDSRKVLNYVLGSFIQREGKKIEWLPEYEMVSEWLADNKQKGLLLYGNCGRGKSLLCRYAIPAILLECAGLVTSTYDMREMNDNIDEVLKKHIISLDDVGTEEISIKFGERRMAFAEIMDNAEKKGNLVIISTNLNLEGLTKVYGDRITDRLKSMTVRIPFKGKSLRG